MRRTFGFDVQLGAGTRFGPYDIVPALGAGASTRGGDFQNRTKYCGAQEGRPGTEKERYASREKA